MRNLVETMQYREMHALVVSFCLKNFLFLAVFENFQSFTKVIEIFFLMFSIFFLKKKWLFVITFTQGFYVIYFCYLSATSEMPHFKST